MDSDDLKDLVHDLRLLPRETEWVELKHNNADPEAIGEYISALSNAAALHHRSSGYILWGVEDRTHELLGTTFCPRDAKVGNEDLENWLLHLLTPRIDVQMHEGHVDGKRVVLFAIQPASHQPVRFKDSEFIRVGTYKKKLKDHPEKERALWDIFATTPFESCPAAAGVSSDDVLAWIDYTSCFKLLDHPLPDNRKAIFDRLSSEKVIVPQPGDRFDITNLGAVLFASDLTRFDRLARKGPRVVIYKGENRTETIKEQTGVRGYAVGFEGLVSYINDQLPQNEQIEQALRHQVRVYPEIAIRELVANALIHQDFQLTGTGPMIEIFASRMEITNPGRSLIDTLRFIDEPPRSRNEVIAGLMRRMSICEERGSGIDKVVSHVEVFQLPAPDFRTTPNHTVAVLFGPRPFAEMDRQDRIRACYQHACLLFVSGKQLANASLRQRLGIEQSSHSLASKVIRDTLDADLIRQAAGTRKDARYVPFWA